MARSLPRAGLLLAPATVLLVLLATPPAGPPPHPPASLERVTGHLSDWLSDAAAVFEPPQSRCRLLPSGKVRPPPPPPPGRMPFLFDTHSMPPKETACGHCPEPLSNLCCGVCVFEGRQCEAFYPGELKSERTAQHAEHEGMLLSAFSPCELFARIRGRTLWFMGDSQTWHYFYSAECFLREFAPSIERSLAVADAKENEKLITVTWPIPVHPICLVLVHGTRVCAIRVDQAALLRTVVLPGLQRLRPDFKDDIVVWNTGLHYKLHVPKEAAAFKEQLAAFGEWRQQERASLPAMVWMDVPVQHFTTPAGDGYFLGGPTPFQCSPLDKFYTGDPLLAAGGRYNAAAAPYVAGLGDAHLQTWNASVALWDSHKPGECTHWCSPSAYHLWLYLLNGVLRDAQLGSPVEVAAAAAGAAAAAEAPT